MDKGVVKNLVSELKRHSEIIIPDDQLFSKMLISADVSESSRFYEKLPDKKQLVEETGRYHYLSLRRILRNKNAKNYKLSKLKRIYETTASVFGIYSSDALTRDLRVDETLMDMMTKCEEEYSLLGKFRTYDFDNPNEKLFIITRPVLVIPGVKDMTPINKWERANTIYKEESRIIGLFPMQRKISTQRYLSY